MSAHRMVARGPFVALLTGLFTVLLAGLFTVLLAGLLTGCAGTGRGGTEPVMPPWAWEMSQCTAYRPAALSAPAHRVAASVAVPDSGVTEQVDVYEAGWGARAMDEIRSVLRECASYEFGGVGDPAALREQHLVHGAGFAGEESLLVETVRLSPPEPAQTWFAAIVRRGDAVTTLRTTGRGADQTRCLAGAQDATCP